MPATTSPPTSSSTQTDVADPNWSAARDRTCLSTEPAVGQEYRDRVRAGEQLVGEIDRAHRQSPVVLHEAWQEFVADPPPVDEHLDQSAR